jgi:PAS domain S-box-containing protein
MRVAFNSIPLKARLLIAPVIGIVLTLILFAVTNIIIQSQNNLLRSLQQANLAQTSEINRFIILLTTNHNQFSSLLHEAPISLDEEQVYLKGRQILDALHSYEKKLLTSFSNEEHASAEQIESGKHISSTFHEYKDVVIGAIELSTVNTKLAHKELSIANDKLELLNNALLAVSERSIENLNEKANAISVTLNKTGYLTTVPLILLIFMVFASLYVANSLSKGLSQISESLIKLSKHKIDDEIVLPKEGYISDLTNAVLEFRKTLLQVEHQQFALDQHSIVAITDTKGTITYANDKFSQISGYATSELIGQNHRIINSGQHDVAFWQDMFEVITKGDVWHGEICNQSKSGAFYWVDTTIVPAKDENGKPVSYIAIRTDITKSKQNAQALEQAIEQAESANRAKSEFISSMSHELRTPLNSIIGFSQLLLMEKGLTSNSEQKENVEYILSSGQYLLSLVNQILDFASIEKGGTSLSFRDVLLNELVQQTIELNQVNAQNAGVQLSVKSTALINLHTDATRLQQVLMNLIDNAIKYSQQGDIVTVSWLQEKENCVKVIVDDTGAGISEDMQTFVFTAFNRLGKENSSILGTGIGLVITKELVESLGGEIGFESTEGKGSTFWFELPIGKNALH